jgi:hypothetical protein
VTLVNVSYVSRLDRRSSRPAGQRLHCSGQDRLLTLLSGTLLSPVVVKRNILLEDRSLTRTNKRDRKSKIIETQESLKKVGTVRKEIVDFTIADILLAYNSDLD